ncbi:hypothetical protein F383_32202 [Gossypium arboreum]|uniref:Uncharacterized protein n=1 Tax=Gossypium arboreum TaxID=29729 RepID=A0A0B0MWI8_GOSAR|nr:hypothetical protein F383_32202 [Gossypium arboreum]
MCTLWIYPGWLIRLGFEFSLDW